MIFALQCDDEHVMILQFSGPQREVSDREVSDELAKATYERRVVSWRKIDPAQLPQSRRFRDAWRDSGAAITEDLAAARSIAIARGVTAEQANAASSTDELAAFLF